jgi:hypothetical protein
MGNLQNPKHWDEIKTEEEAKFEILGWIKRAGKLKEKMASLERDLKFAEAEIITILEKFNLGRWFKDV